MSETSIKNEVKAKSSDNEQVGSNDSDIALNGFLDLLEHDISNNPDKQVEETENHKKELEEVIGDYQVDLEGKY